MCLVVNIEAEMRAGIGTGPWTGKSALSESF